MANSFERQTLYQTAIEDAERRLGSYLAMDGCEKTDSYAQQQIAKNRSWAEKLDKMYEEGELISGILETTN